MNPDPRSQDQRPLQAEVEEARTALESILAGESQPSAWELLSELERRIGSKARLSIRSALEVLAEAPGLTRSQREYWAAIRDSKDLGSAIEGDRPPGLEVISSVDSLLAKSRLYKNSAAFREMVRFMGAFKEYAPYNNMLVRLQNPSCSYYATEKDWGARFQRTLKEEARPMLILAPRHPVLLVYDLDQTEGPPLPERLQAFARFQGEWKPNWLTQLIANAEGRERVEIRVIELSSTQAGYAAFAPREQEWKRRIRIHDGLDEPSRFGVLCHELAHVFLGHLGGDPDGWWPSRSNLGRAAEEIEAEAVAFIVTERLGLRGSSADYVSSYLGAGPVPPSVSLDYIAKVAGRIEKMARTVLPPRRQKAGNRSNQSTEDF